MRKELIFAVFAGLLFGLIIAFGIWRANSAIQRTSPPLISQNSGADKDKIPLDSNLTLAEPGDFDVVGETPLKISGITQPDSWIAISGPKEDLILKSDNSGVFEGEIDLEAGVNQFLLSVFTPAKKEINKEFIVVYSSKFPAN